MYSRGKTLSFSSILVYLIFIFTSTSFIDISYQGPSLRNMHMYVFLLTLTTTAATFTHRLGVLAKRVTWDDVGDDTDPKIIKTSEQTIAPFP